tara:strand:- start:559 stop:1287 length:729 start_codon:yes stop_codon:yes gene_type:complete
MRKEKILAPTIYIEQVKESNSLKGVYLETFLRNYQLNPNLSKDWNIHTDFHKNSKPLVKGYDYSEADDPENEINSSEYNPCFDNRNANNNQDTLIEPVDFDIASKVYSRYINNFLSSLDLGIGPNDWEFAGDLWYNVYGKGQLAELHTHIGHSFSLVHFMKFEKGLHSPIVFVDVWSGDEFSPDISEGDLLMFPSHIKHKVPPNAIEDLRISIAFNIFVKNDPDLEVNIKKKQRVARHGSRG